MMGDIIRPGDVPMKFAVEVIGTAPLDRVDVLHGTQVVQSARPFTAADLGRRIRILWQGAEYRGRGRETMWNGKLAVTGNRIARFAPVNFLNPERKVQEVTAGTALAWTSVTTGNLAGIDLWLDEPAAGVLRIETNIVSGDVELGARRRYRDLRRRRPWPEAQRLSATGDRLEPRAHSRTSSRFIRAAATVRSMCA